MAAAGTKEAQGLTTYNNNSVGAQASICRRECPEMGVEGASNAKILFGSFLVTPQVSVFASSYRTRSS